MSAEVFVAEFVESFAGDSVGEFDAEFVEELGGEFVGDFDVLLIAITSLIDHLH